MTRTWWYLVTLGAAATISVNAMQGPQVASVMREKLGHTQKILEAMVTSDWVALETQSRVLEELTNDRRWFVLNSPEYARHSTSFKQAVHDLHAAAVTRDLDEAPKAYAAMTLQCVDCHRYLARARLAK